MRNPLGRGVVFWGIQGSLAVPGSAENSPPTLSSSSSSVFPCTANPSTIYIISLRQDAPQPHGKFTARLPKILILLLMPSPAGICSQIPHSKRARTVPCPRASSWPQGHAPNRDMQPPFAFLILLRDGSRKNALKNGKGPAFPAGKGSPAPLSGSRSQEQAGRTGEGDAFYTKRLSSCPGPARRDVPSKISQLETIQAPF